MKLFRLAMVAVMAIASLTTMAQTTLDIIPKPLSVEISGGKTFELRNGATIWASGPDALLSAQYVARYCRDYLGMHIEVGGDRWAAAVRITCDEAFTGKPNYELRVSESGVDITGKGAPEAAFHGVQTLIQLLPTRAGDIPRLPHCVINDAPRYDLRMMHLDVVRHFFPVNYVKQYIDWLALHKFNYFHWHLTDDQGWRIELKSHPELTERGSYRAGEIKGLFPGEYYERPYEAYYTQEQIKEVIEYARERYITVIPEIDMPGHCMAVLAVHPEFSTTPDEAHHTAQTWGIYNRQNNVLAPSDTVMRFITEVFDEVCQLFPSEYIHAGGDECAAKWWNESAATQSYMQAHGIADAKALQAHFMQHIVDVCQRHGKMVMGWDGGIELVGPEGCVLETWLMREGMKQSLINTTHKWINANGLAHYFDFHEDSTQTEVMHGMGRLLLPVRKVFDYALVPDSASAVVADNLIGVAGCLWTEYCPETWKCEYMVFPRLSALAEKAWVGQDWRKGDESCREAAWSDFGRRLLVQLSRYDLWRIRYNPTFEKNNDEKRDWR